MELEKGTYAIQMVWVQHNTFFRSTASMKKILFTYMLMSLQSKNDLRFCGHFVIFSHSYVRTYKCYTLMSCWIVFRIYDINHKMFNTLDSNNRFIRYLLLFLILLSMNMSQEILHLSKVA